MLSLAGAGGGAASASAAARPMGRTGSKPPESDTNWATYANIPVRNVWEGSSTRSGVTLRPRDGQPEPSDAAQADRPRAGPPGPRDARTRHRAALRPFRARDAGRGRVRTPGDGGPDVRQPRR